MLLMHVIYIRPDFYSLETLLKTCAMLIKILTCSSSSVVRYGNVPVVARATSRLQLYTGGCRYFKKNVSVYLVFDFLKWHINPLHFIYLLFSFAIAYDCKVIGTLLSKQITWMCAAPFRCVLTL